MEKRKKKAGNGLAAAVMFVCCAAIGFLIGSIVDLGISEEAGFLEFMIKYLFQILLLFLAFYLQNIIHEGGHLAAGLITGYRFSSFRIGSLMLLKNSEGYSFRKFSLAGTGGQCLMIPPDKRPDGSYPYKLYHLGGVLLNLITAAVFLAVSRICTAGSGAGMFLTELAVCGVLCAVMNGIPMRVSGIATDGYNVIHIGKEPFALEAVWLQLKINEAQTEGIRPKELPEEWFTIPENASKDNEIVSAIAVFAENRAMDELDFRKAKELIAALDENGEYSVVGLYRNLLLLDKITVALTENGADTDISALNSKKMKSFRKAMARFPSVIRTEYALALLKEKDEAKAEKYKAILQKIAKKYPAKSDIASETEIMEHLARYAGQMES